MPVIVLPPRDQDDDGNGRGDRGRPDRQNSGRGDREGNGSGRLNRSGTSSSSSRGSAQDVSASAPPVATKKERVPCVIARCFHVPRKIVVRSLEILDAKDSPDRPGMMYEKTLREMVARFDTVFGNQTRGTARSEYVESLIDHLRRHTKRRRGEEVLDEGYLEWEQTSRIYELFSTNLNVFERIFFTVDVGESSSVLSKVCSLFLVIMIVISIAMWMVSTLPSVQEIPATLDGVDCATSITIGDCMPQPHELFQIVEAVCVLTFTVEYLVRALTVHSVRFALLNEHFMVAVLAGTNVKDLPGGRISISEASDFEVSKQPNSKDDKSGKTQDKMDGKLKTLFKHVVGASNVIDLLAIIPWWLETLDLQAGGGFLVVLRILRLSRIFRVFKLGKYNDVMTLFGRVVTQSLPALLLMVFFIGLGCCLFGTLMWFAEQGVWYPKGNPALELLDITGRGAYLRLTGSKDAPTEADPAKGLAESPYYSIIHSFWYVIVTVTTVGYGDISPTTAEGKVIASVAILNGIIVLAMPIGVVGTNFGTEFFYVLEEKKRRARMKEQLETRARMERQEDAALNEEAIRAPTQSEALPDGGATELLRVASARARILSQAELLDQSWEKILPEVLHKKLSDCLRFFVVGFITTQKQAVDDAPEVTGFSAKPKVQMSRLRDLDALTAQVTKAISTITSIDELSEFGLKENLEIRRQWFTFTDHCWDYATGMCIIEKQQEPPDYFQIKACLAAKVNTSK